MNIEKDTKINRDEELFFNNRILFMESDFDDCEINKLKKDLILLDSSASDPIIIVINSRGGDADNLLCLYSIIQNLSCPLITIGTGYCYSAGALLLLMGDERYALPETRIMFHEMSAKAEGRIQDLNITINEYNENQKFMYKLIKKKTKIKNIEEWLKTEKYLSVSDAIKLGILTKKCNGLPNVKIKEE